MRRQVVAGCRRCRAGKLDEANRIEQEKLRVAHANRRSQPMLTIAEAQANKEKLDDDIDAILDEIDEVLESNAEDFVKSFIQKGGE